MICTYQMGRRRLSKMVMRGVHLHLFFFRRLCTMKWRRTHKKLNGGVHLIMSHIYQMNQS